MSGDRDPTSGGDRAVAREESTPRPPGRSCPLPRTGLTHERHRLAAADLERDAPHGLDQRALDAEGDGEIVNFEKGLGAHASARDGAIARAAR